MSEAEDYAWAMKPPSAGAETPVDPQQEYERVKRRLDRLHGEFTSTLFRPGCGFDTKSERDKALCVEYSLALSELRYRMYTQDVSWAESMSAAVDGYLYHVYYMCTGTDK